MWKEVSPLVFGRSVPGIAVAYLWPVQSTMKSFWEPESQLQFMYMCTSVAPEPRHFIFSFLLSFPRHISSPLVSLVSWSVTIYESLLLSIKLTSYYTHGFLISYYGPDCIHCALSHFILGHGGDNILRMLAHLCVSWFGGHYKKISVKLKDAFSQRPTLNSFCGGLLLTARGVFSLARSRLQSQVDAVHRGLSVIALMHHRSSGELRQVYLHGRLELASLLCPPKQLTHFN